MQHYKVFFGPDDPWGATMPTDDQRRRAVSKDNPQSPFAKVKGNDLALCVFQDIAFQALGRPDHLCRDKVLVLLGNGKEEKAKLAQAFAQAVALPFVTIDSNTAWKLDDILEEISAVLEAENVPLVEVIRPNHFVLPPCVIFFTEISDHRHKVVQGVLGAINDESWLLRTEAGKTVNCFNACWILADWVDTVSSLIVPERKAVLNVASVDPLRKWQESGEPQKWVEAHGGRWTHQDWLGLLAALKNTQYWPMEEEAVGAVLEGARREWEKRQPPPPSLPPPATTIIVAGNYGQPAATVASAGQAVPSPGISDPAAARQAAQKKAAAPCHAVPVETRRLSEAEHPVFSGDAPCPRCKTLLWVEWKNTTVTMKCPQCGHRFDGEQAVAFLSAYKPEDNFKPELGPLALELPGLLEQAKALLAGQGRASSPAGESPPPPPKKRGKGHDP